MAELAELRSRVPEEIPAVLQRASQLGFLGGMTLTDQIDHSLGFVLTVERVRPGVPRTALDLGTGGGVPGLVLGACWPGCRLSLLDAGGRRTEFLRREIGCLPRPDHVDVLHGRAEELGRDPAHRGRFEVVTARAFGRPTVVAESGSPFLLVGGVLVVSEPPSGGTGRWPGEGLAMLGLEDGGPTEFGENLHYRVLRKRAPTPDRFPRRTGVPGKRPLF